MSVVEAGALGRRVDLVRELVLRDVRLRYRRSVLGVAWSQLAPLSLLVIMTIVFTKIIPLGIPDHPVFALTGLLAWTWFQTSMLSATVSVTDGADLVRRPRFPVGLLPPTAVVSQMAHFLLALPVLLGAIIVVTGRLPATAVLIPVLLAIQFVVTLGPAYVLAALQVPVRDIGHALTIVLQLWFFATPIFYDDQRLIDSSFPDRLRTKSDGASHHCVSGCADQRTLARSRIARAHLRRRSCPERGRRHVVPATGAHLPRGALGMTAISVRGVSKRFRHGGPGARTLKELVLTGFRDLRERREFWALEDVSFEVPAGASVGILGPNGAGKTTLLRLIGGIGRPTRGAIEVQGRLSAIFELGAGFHPDLTGRERVLLAGIIAGLSRDETRARMDEIVDFAELAEFIDEPVRMYSTGMVARLAFSVATNVDAEVLLVDEVLAVGDLAFQRKRRERFEEFKRAGVTLLLVTNDPAFVADLCDEAVWLQGGRVAATGSPTEITELYRTAMQQRTMDVTPDDAREVGTLGGATLRLRHNRWGTQEAQVQNVRLIDGQGSTLGRIMSGDGLIVEADAVVPAALGEVHLLVHIVRSDGVRCVDTSTVVRSVSNRDRHTAALAFDRVDLAPGDYSIEVGLYSTNWGETYDFHSGVYGLKVLGESFGEAVVMPPHIWTVTKQELGGTEGSTNG